MRSIAVLLVALALAGCSSPGTQTLDDEADAEITTPSRPGSTNAGPGGAASGGTSGGTTTAPSLPVWTSRFDANVQIAISGGVLSLTTDGVPQHGFGPFPMMDDTNGDGRPDNPDRVVAQTMTFRVPLVPTPAAKPSATPMGPIGLAVDGVPFFNAMTADGADAVRNEVFDACLGHPDERGLYHYHQRPACVHDETAGMHSPMYGIALDGYLVFGAQDVDGARPPDLDACNGHEGAMPDGTTGYHYHLTLQAPWTVPCYHGDLQPDARPAS